MYHHVSSDNVPFEHIVLNYDREKEKLSAPLTMHTRAASTWPVLIQSMVERLSLSSLHQQIHSSDEDYLILINQTIYRCTRNVEESFHLHAYFRRKIEHELRHLKLPSYVRWIRMSNFSLDNTYPTIDQLKNIWWNEHGLWTAVDLTYQGNISFEFTIKINLRRVSSMNDANIFHQILSKVHHLLPNRLKEVFVLSDHYQVLTNIVNTMLMITVGLDTFLPGSLLDEADDEVALSDAEERDVCSF